MTSAVQVTMASKIEAGLSFLAAILAAEGESVPMSKAAATELSAAVEAWRPSAAPDDLVARPCLRPAARWHLEHLLSTAPHDATGRARRMFHARLLGFLLAPDRPHFSPLVTILIPVHNRAAMCKQAVESCLAQSWRPLEILVVDDGSIDDLASALRPFGEVARLLRKPNGGVATARNAGIAAARGDFIHFLDSDDLLLPEAVECKVAGFACIPDAALCYSMTISENLPGVAVPRIRIPDGSASCATSDLLSATLRRYPFFVPTVMMPRWTMLDVGPFEEDLRRGEDSRYWFRLGLAGIKVIGLTAQLTVRRMVPDGLSVTPHVGRGVIDIQLRDLRDLLCTPSAWRHAGRLLRAISDKLDQNATLSDQSLNLIAARDQILATLAGFGDGRARDALSPVPLLVDLQNLLRLTWPSDRSADHPRSRLWRDLRLAVAAALKSAAPMTQRDLDYWGGDGPPAARETTIYGLFRSLLGAAATAPDLLARIDKVLRRANQTPSARTVKRYRKLRRKIGSGLLAAWLTWLPRRSRPLS